MAYGGFLTPIRYISVFSAFAFSFRQSGMLVVKPSLCNNKNTGNMQNTEIYREPLYQSSQSWWKHDKQLLCLQCSLHVFDCNTYFLYNVPTTPHIYSPISYTISCKPIYRTHKYASAKYSSSSPFFVHILCRKVQREWQDFQLRRHFINTWIIPNKFHTKSNQSEFYRKLWAFVSVFRCFLTIHSSQFWGKSIYFLIYFLNWIWWGSGNTLSHLARCRAKPRKYNLNQHSEFLICFRFDLYSILSQVQIPNESELHLNSHCPIQLISFSWAETPYSTQH